jgi:hypothetical protein
MCGIAMFMSNTASRQKPKISVGVVAAVVILAVMIGYALYITFFGGGGGGGGSGGGGGGGTTTTPTPGPSPPPNLLYPNAPIPNGYDLILVEDHVSVSGGQYQITTSAVGYYKSIVGYGGSTVSGNITNGIALIKYGGYDIPVLGFASTNSTLVKDFPGIQVRLNTDGGYVLYVPVNMAIYYRHMQFNISGTLVNVWVPARTLPTTLTSASAHVTVDPQYGVYYVNGVAYGLEWGTPPQKHRGVLRGWLVYTSNSGRYSFTINP